MYKMNFLTKGGRRQCPVEGCPGVSETRAAMRVHFVHRNVHNTVVILEEGNLPLPRCPRCDLQVSRRALNGRHMETNQCKTGAEKKQRRLAAAEVETATEKAFHAYRKKMRAVTELRYLGRVMTNTDDNWRAVAGDLRKARVTWGRLARILGREGGGPKSVTQFLYCRDTAGPPLWGGDLGPHQEDGGCPGTRPGQPLSSW